MNNLGHMPPAPVAAQRQAPFQTTSSAQMMSSASINGDDSDSESKPGKRSGRRKIKIEFIEDKSRRHITFSKRKAGIMKKVIANVSKTGLF